MAQEPNFTPKISRKKWQDIAEEHGLDLVEMLIEVSVAALEMGIHMQFKLPPNQVQKNHVLAKIGQKELVLRTRD